VVASVAGQPVALAIGQPLPPGRGSFGWAKAAANRVATYELLNQAGYTTMVAYLAQQIHQFRLLGKEFAMQHLGTEDELKKVMHDILPLFSPEERLEGLSPEERLRGLSAAERDRMRLLLQQPPPEEADSSSGK
jgi:hypothetical protein